LRTETPALFFVLLLLQPRLLLLVPMIAGLRCRPFGQLRPALGRGHPALDLLEFRRPGFLPLPLHGFGVLHEPSLFRPL
jgi:hypothetical protein